MKKKLLGYSSLSTQESRMRAEPLHQRVLSMSRVKKRFMMLFVDLLALPLALWSAYVLRLNELWPQEHLFAAAWLFLVVPFLGVLIFVKLGLYRAVVRYMGSQAIWTVIIGVTFLSLLLWAFAVVLEISPFPRSIPFNFALVAFVYVGGTRLLMRSYYQWLMNRFLNKETVLIYGAGTSGVQLSKALASTYDICCVGFLDDDPSLWGSSVTGLRVYKPSKLDSLLSKRKIDSVLLAIPSANHKQRKRILNRLSNYPVHVRTVPPMSDLISGESLVSLRDVAIEDLLGRETVPPIQSLIDDSVQGKVVMVTGAGGSIGAELCRQIIANKPAMLILFELSEFALYTVEQEIKELIQELASDSSYVALLGSVCDAKRVDEVIERYKMQTIYHAAAYKHVPLVEHNLIEGVRNNTIGTEVVAKAAVHHSVERFVLVSTDKAVRPANVMGASKRLAELILQDLAKEVSQLSVPFAKRTIFSMVRFGNVLDSSGSVVPLFRRQIESGGPVTVTHPEITRYFMTIPEAASLVIQAGSMAKGGDVFVLDMGQPVKIVDLARRMIRLSGFEVLDDQHPDGDIELSFCGLRPGEKLYEELLIGDEVIGTSHPKIMRALEETLSSKELKAVLSELHESIGNSDYLQTQRLLQSAVSGYKPATNIQYWLNDTETRVQHEAR